MFFVRPLFRGRLSSLLFSFSLTLLFIFLSSLFTAPFSPTQISAFDVLVDTEDTIADADAGETGEQAEELADSNLHSDPNGKHNRQNEHAKELQKSLDLQLKHRAREMLERERMRHQYADAVSGEGLPSSFLDKSTNEIVVPNTIEESIGLREKQSHAVFNQIVPELTDFVSVKQGIMSSFVNSEIQKKIATLTSEDMRSVAFKLDELRGQLVSRTDLRIAHQQDMQKRLLELKAFVVRTREAKIKKDEEELENAEIEEGKRPREVVFPTMRPSDELEFEFFDSNSGENFFDDVGESREEYDYFNLNDKSARSSKHIVTNYYDSAGTTRKSHIYPVVKGFKFENGPAMQAGVRIGDSLL